MKFKLLGALFLILSAPAFADIKVCYDKPLPYRCGILPDLNFDLGVGQTLGGGGLMMFRGKSGIMFINEPTFTSIDLAASIYSGQMLDLMLQVEVMHLYSGTWVQFGAGTVLPDRNLAMMFGLGWSLFGAEFNGRMSNDGCMSWSVIGKVRLPLSLLLFSL